MNRKIILFFLIISICNSGFSYPITPKPLRKMVIESENIVYAHVKSIKKLKKKQGWNDSKAILEVKEVLQGKIQEREISVLFSPNFVCPAPPVYVEGKSVLAFIDKNDDKKGFVTHALSYGTKILEEKDYKIFRQRIEEIREINAIKNDDKKRDKTIGWLIRCVEEPATRWDGVYELSPESDFMSYYDYDNETFLRKFKLNSLQKNQLRNILLKIDEIQYEDLALIDLVAKKRDNEVLDFLIKKTKEINLSKLWFRDFLMEKIVSLSKRKDLEEILQKIFEIEYN